MKPSRQVLVYLLVFASALMAQDAPQFSAVQRLANRELNLKFNAAAGKNWRLDGSTDLVQWTAMATLLSPGSVEYADSGAPFMAQRFYRAASVDGTNILTGDHLATDLGDAIIHPINHATFVIGWHGIMIYVDPVGGSAPFQGLPRADLILITHDHTDHFDANTLTSVKGTNAAIIAPLLVSQKLSASLKSITTVMTNGARMDFLGLSVEAMPMYNLTSSYHVKGAGNGYILSLGGKRVYVAGDTEGIPEMLALRDIDVAFLPINQPYTMTPAQALNAVKAFCPKVLYPYHYKGYSSADLTSFKQSVTTDLGVEVRLRKWY
jgi:L-ascorbate metabolism protein UlaG (beta-lactamase superfamily)